MLAKPLLDIFPLRAQHDTLPFHGTGALAVLSHYVGAFVEDQDESASRCPLKSVRWEGSVVFSHLLLG